MDQRVEETAQGLGELLTSDGTGLLPSNVASQDIVQNIASFLKQAAINPTMRLQAEEMVGAVLVSGLTLVAIKSFFSTESSSPGALMDGPPNYYDAEMIDAYYRARPGLVVRRLLTALNASKGFLSGLLMDYVMGTKEENAEKRAKQLTVLISDLGPVFIKVGQLISVRPDIASPAYLKALQQLQDQVKPFSSAEAQAIIAQNLPPGTGLSDVYNDPDSAFSEPVAAASLGQVYRAELKDGTPVAVKCQRPNMLENVTLDLYTLRLLTSLGTNIERFRQSCEGFIDVLDNWAGRFLQELDYEREALNSRKFAAAMKSSPIVSEAIIVPEVCM